MDNIKHNLDVIKETSEKEFKEIFSEFQGFFGAYDKNTSKHEKEVIDPIEFARRQQLRGLR